MVQQCKELAQKLGRTPKLSEFDQYANSNCSSSVRKHFKSWNNFLKECNLDIHKMTFVSKEEMVEYAIRASKILGKTPTVREFNDLPEFPNALYGKKLFGSWNKLIEAAGLLPNKLSYTRNKPHPNANRESPTGVALSVVIRFSESEWKKVKDNAKKSKMKPTAYVRHKVLESDKVITAVEAGELWNLGTSTVKRACQTGRFFSHEARKSGGTWLVTITGMERVYGPMPTKEE